jgi:hypothetical protein
MSVYGDQAASWYVRVGCLVLVARDRLRWIWHMLKMSAEYVRRSIDEIGTIQKVFIRAV